MSSCFLVIVCKFDLTGMLYYFIFLVQRKSVFFVVVMVHLASIHTLKWIVKHPSMCYDF